MNEWWIVLRRLRHSLWFHISLRLFLFGQWCGSGDGTIRRWYVPVKGTDPSSQNVIKDSN